MIMTTRQHKTVVFAVIPFFAAGGIILDFFTPLGVADWVWYFIPLLLSVYVGGRSLPYVLAAVFSLLTLAGFFLSPPGIDLHLAFVSRLMGISVQWLMAFLISQRKSVESELRTANEFNKEVISGANEGIIVYDRELRYRRWNHFMEQLTGLSAGEVLGRKALDLFPQFQGQGVDHLHQRALKGETVYSDDIPYHMPRTGKQGWVKETYGPHRDASGEIIGVIGMVLDITERKRTEKELKESKTRFESLFEDAPVGYHELNEEGLITRVNRTELGMLGYTAEEMVGHFVWDFVAEREITREAIMAKLAGKTPVTEVVERNYRRKDGSFLPVLIENRMLHDNAGRVVGVRSTLQEITERKRAEQQLAETLGFNQKIISEAPEGILVYKASGQCVLANEAAAQTVNATVAELLKQNFRQIESWRISGMLKMAEETLDIRSPKHGEFHFTSTFGKETWLVCHFSFFVRGNEPHLLLLFNDVIERKQAEEAWRQSREEFKDLFDNAPVGFHEVDAEGRLVRINNTELKLLGYSAEELLGQFVWKISGEEETSRRAALAKLRGEVSPPPEGFERMFRRKDGSTFPVLINDRILKREDGAIIGIRAAIQDITGRKRAELALSDNEKFLNTVIENIPHMIFVKDAKELRFLKFNKAGEELLGYSLKELIGKNDHDFFPKELADHFTENDRQVLRGKEVVDIPEEPVQTRNKGERILHTKKIPVFDNAGQLVYLLGISEDITERRQMEAELDRERDLWRTLLDNSPDHIYFKDAQSRFIKSSKAQARQFGVASPDEMVGKTDFDFFAEAHARPAFEDEQEIIRTGRPIIAKEEREVWNDGHVTWASSTKMPMRDDTGKIVGIMGISRDITERKRTEEALCESKALYHSLVEQMPTGLFRKDLAGRYVFVNSWFCQLRGLKANQIVGWTPDELAAVEKAAHNELRPEILHLLRDGSKHHDEILRTGKPMHVEEVYPTAEGGKRYLHVVKSAVFGPDGQIVGTQGIQFDVTSLKQAEEHVREQAALLDKAQDAIMVLDLDDCIAYWNKSAERIYGWSAAEAAGKNPLDLFLGGAISPRHAEAIKTVKERGEWSGELQEITKDGKTITVQGRCNAIRDEQGRPKSMLIINTDVTERKKLEAQFLRSQRMESLGTLAGGIAHDLNNVLTPLLVAVQVLKEKITDADGKRLLESLEANVQRGAGLVKQVLAFGRGMEGERIVVQPKHIAREIKQIVNETFPKSVAFELHCAADLWSITGDPTQLHQVLLNLCLNARDAMPKGGKLSLHIENVVLDEVYASTNLEARPGPHVCLTVRDTGTGIPKEIQERIFDPFFTTKEPGKGTGLGLSTTLAIVKSHGGFIHFYSEPGKGSTFKVYIPGNTTLAGAKNVVEGKARLLHGHNELVLVVDDEEPIRELAQRVLERFGYRVLLAADGAEAISLYQPRRNEIDVVITDMVMPNMDGLATITALKSINPEVKIVGSSGQASNGSVSKVMAAGIQHFIPKPYTAETMLNALHEVLNGKQ